MPNGNQTTGNGKDQSNQPVNPFEDSFPEGDLGNVSEQHKEQTKENLDEFKEKEIQSQESDKQEEVSNLMDAEQRAKNDAKEKLGEEEAKKEIKQEENFRNEEEVQVVNPFEREVKKPGEEFKQSPKAEDLEEEKREIEPEKNGESEEQMDDDAQGEVLSGEVVSKSVPEKPPVSGVDGGKLEDKSDPSEDVSGFGDFQEDFWDILAHAGITKKKLFWIVGILIFVFLFIIFMIFGGLNIFGGSENREVLIGEEDVQEEEDISDTSDAHDAYGIITSYIIGLEFSEPTTAIVAKPISSFSTSVGVRAAFELGDPEVMVREEFVYYVEVLRRMKNIFDTDVYALVDMGVDRRGVLRSFLNEAESLITEAEALRLEIRNTIIQLQQSYDLLSQERDNYEFLFFNSLENSRLEGQKAYEYLQSFIEFSNQAAALRARHRAYVTLDEKYGTFLSALNPRFQDIQANFEAIVQGVRVFKVPGSDIDAIIEFPPR